MEYKKGNFDDLSSLDQTYYHKCLRHCNNCKTKQDCRQDARYQMPVIGVTSSGRTVIDWTYCYRRNEDQASTVGINSPINQQTKSIDDVLGNL